MTPERIFADAIQLLRDYGRWDGDLVMSDESWDTRSGLPKLTQELFDRKLELQRRRNVILAEAPAEWRPVAPTEPGWYWRKNMKLNIPIIEYVFNLNGEMLIYRDDGDHDNVPENENEWCGPLLPPPPKPPASEVKP